MDTEPVTEYKQEAATLRVISHPTRLLLLELLGDFELPVTALQDQTDLPQAVISQHLATLRRAGIVAARPHGTARLYRLSDRRVQLVMKALKSKP